MRPFAEVRGLMRQYDITQVQLARRLGIGYTAMNGKINAHQSFTLEECYAILDMFKIPHTRLHEVFPKISQKTISAYHTRTPDKVHRGYSA